MTTYAAIHVQIAFVGPGSILEPEPDRLALDTGNRTVPGVIDHHQDSAQHECTASLIVQQPGLVLDHLAGRPPGAITFVLHRSPDFDATAGAYLAQALLLAGRLPAGSAALAAYALAVDSGNLPASPAPERTPYALMAGIGRVVDAMPPDEAEGEDAHYTRDRRVVARGFELMDYLRRWAGRGRALTDPALFSGKHPFEAEAAAVRDDYAKYLHDLAGGQVQMLALPSEGGGPLRPTSFLTVHDPTSALFKVWARQDRTHSPDGRGFVLTSVQYGTDRFIISVDPQAGVHLRGLGAALDQAETVKRGALDQPRPGPPRPGYDNADPWYDGRAPIHRYTIVDAPRAGTVLTAAEVATLVAQPAQWAMDAPALLVAQALREQG